MEVVKPFKCILDASANLLVEPVPMGDWIRHAMYVHENIMNHLSLLF